MDSYPVPWQINSKQTYEEWTEVSNLHLSNRGFCSVNALSSYLIVPEKLAYGESLVHQVRVGKSCPNVVCREAYGLSFGILKESYSEPERR